MPGKSIKFQVIVALLIQLAVLFGIVFTSLHLLKLRQHDYLILNLAGQLRVIAQTMATQSENYIEHAPRDYSSYQRDLGLYHRDLQLQIKNFDKIIDSFKARALPAELVSFYYLSQANTSKAKVPALVDQSQTIYCTWDVTSRSQLNVTASIWQEFRAGLMQELGANKNEPRLEAAAQYILLHEQDISLATSDMATAFRGMMENKLNDIKLLNKIAIVIISLISFTLIFLLYLKVFRPIDETVRAFERVAKGHLHYQVPVKMDNEVGNMTAAFNNLTKRISTLFRLTDRINQATNLDEILRFVYEEFQPFLPIDWVGLLQGQDGNGSFNLERIYTNKKINLNEREKFEIKSSILSEVLVNRKPIGTSTITSNYSDTQDPFLSHLASAGLQSAFILPLITQGRDVAVLVFAALDADVYNLEHLEFMENIAGQVSHSFEKTIGMENLIISTVEGLAKLAESRDPETGDHLYRMSHYSAIIADELSKTGEFKNAINPAYVRDVFRFSPMHDIGKVGISDDILLKPGRLSEEERKSMEQHPLIGAEVLRRCDQQVESLGRSIFQVGIEIAEGHHEKYDGSGYPHGLKAEAIPLSARIVAVADVFDALTSKRPYKEAWPIDKALQVMRSEAGKHFDPEVIAILQRAMPRILSIYEKHKHV